MNQVDKKSPFPPRMVHFGVPVSMDKEKPRAKLRVEQFCGLTPGILHHDRVEFADLSKAQCFAMIDSVQIPKRKSLGCVPIINLDLTPVPNAPSFIHHLVGLVRGHEPFFLTAFYDVEEDPILTIVDNCLESVGDGPLMARFHLAAAIPVDISSNEESVLRRFSTELKRSEAVMLLISINNDSFGFIAYNERSPD